MTERAARHPSGCSRAERGQAQLELLAAIPILLAAAAIALQMMSMGYAQTLADGSAEAGAIALSSGLAVEQAARSALPGWAESRLEVEVDGGLVGVQLRPPALLPGLGGRLEVSSSAWARPGDA